MTLHIPIGFKYKQVTLNTSHLFPAIKQFIIDNFKITVSKITLDDVNNMRERLIHDHEIQVTHGHG